MTADFILPYAILKNKEIRRAMNSMGPNLLTEETNSTMGLSAALQPFVGPWPLFVFLIIYSFGRTPWTGDQPVARLLHTHTGQHKHRLKVHGHQVGFETTNSVFERAKIFHAFERAATVISTRTQLQLLKKLVKVKVIPVKIREGP
jgi:hypothetical protein